MMRHMKSLEYIAGRRIFLTCVDLYVTSLCVIVTSLTRHFVPGVFDNSDLN